MTMRLPKLRSAFAEIKREESRKTVMLGKHTKSNKGSMMVAKGGA